MVRRTRSSEGCGATMILITVASQLNLLYQRSSTRLLMAL